MDPGPSDWYLRQPAPAVSRTGTRPNDSAELPQIQTAKAPPADSLHRHRCIQQQRNFNTTLTIVSHNTHGLGLSNAATGGRKIDGLRMCWESVKPDVILLQETHSTAADTDLLASRLGEYHCFWAHSSTRSGSRSRSLGSAVLISKKRVLHGGLKIKEHSDTLSKDGRLAAVSAEWQGHQLHIASLYFPNNEAEKKQFIQRRLLPLYEQQTSSHKTCIWGGDFNWVPDIDHDRITPLASPHPDNHVQEVWSSALPNLTDSFRFLHPDSKQYTFFHHQGAARLDRIYVSACANQYITGAQILKGHMAPGSATISDHRPVFLKLLHRQPLRPPPIPGSLRTLPPRLRTDFLADKDLRQKWVEAIEALSTKIPEDPQQVLRWWPRSKMSLSKLALTLTKENRKRLREQLITADKEVEEVERRIELGDQSAGVDLAPAKLQARNAKRAAEKSLLKRPWLHLREMPSKSLTDVLKPPKFSGCGPSLRPTPADPPVSSPFECARIMINHYANISKQPPVDRDAQAEVLECLSDSPKLSPEDDSPLTISAGEVEAALRKVNPETAPGIDGFKMVHYKSAARPFSRILSKVYSAMGELGQNPKDFSVGIITPVPKSGDRSIPTNYRPISLLNTDYRILATVIGERLSKHLPKIIDQAQTAFIKGRSIGENIWILQMLPQALWYEVRTAFIVLCDIQKAYDTVDRKFLLSIMEKLGAGPGLLQWVTLLLKETKARALVMGALSPLMEFRAGVRQGCPLAPLLYLFIGQALICYLKAKGIGLEMPDYLPIEELEIPDATSATVGVDYRAGDHLASLPRMENPTNWHLTALQYADDLKALLPSADDVPRFLGVMDTFAKASGQQLSKTKTKLLPIGRQKQLPEEIGGLKVASEAKALGITFRHFNTQPIVNWDELLAVVSKCYTRLANRGLSIFGRGIASSTYGISKLLHAAEFVQMPEHYQKKLIAWTTRIVDRDDPPEPVKQSFAGLRYEFLWGSPATGGVGVLPLQQHLMARRAKWALQMLQEGTNKPWMKLVWALIWYVTPTPAMPDALFMEHLQSSDWPINECYPRLQTRLLPHPVQWLIDAVDHLPPLGRQIRRDLEPDEFVPDWILPSTLFKWRITRDPRYFNWILQQGLPCWNSPAQQSSRHRRKLNGPWNFSVSLGTRLLCQSQAKKREERVLDFLGEAGVGLTPAAKATAIPKLFTNLWRLPVANKFKEPFWRCALDSIPTAARLHKNDKCGCGTGPIQPSRQHHFLECAVANGIYELISSQIPTATIPEIKIMVRTTSCPDPALVYPPIWRLTCLAAFSAMESGRKWLWQAIHIQREQKGETLVTRALAHATAHFWSVLLKMGRGGLPPPWRPMAEVPHPFLGWDRVQETWCISKFSPL